jgi:hypothetical protein
MIMELFGEFQVRIDPWQAEYGPELAADSDSTDARESALEDVDVPRSQWQPILPPSTVAPPALVFVDGVRRIEARIQIPQANGFVYGAFGSYAVGCAYVGNEAADRKSVV